MPYVIRERLKTAGKNMYLIDVPITDSSEGRWTTNKEEAARFNNIESATAVREMLSVTSSGVVEFLDLYDNTPIKKENEEMSESEWVIQSKITDEFCVQAHVYREPEIWSHTLNRAKRFETLKEAQEFFSDFLLGNDQGPFSNGQSVSIDYVAVPVKERRRTTVVSHYYWVVRCNGTLKFLANFKWANKRAPEWVTHVSKAKRFSYKEMALMAADRVKSPTVSVTVFTVDNKTHKILTHLVVENNMPEKKNFDVRMHHHVGYQVDVMYPDMTEMEALDKMFEEAKIMGKPLTAGMVKELKGTVHQPAKTSKPADYKSM